VRPAPRSMACVLVSTVMFGSACGSPPGKATLHGALGGDAVARVGDVVITAPLLARVAAAQDVAPAQALALLVDDALAANGAHVAGLDRTADVARAVTAGRARLTALRVREHARAAGPPTDAEVDELTRVHWLQVDLPEQRRVIHALVLTPKDPSPLLSERALGLAGELATSEAQASSPDDFESRAKALPARPGLEVKVERLEPFVADGRIALPGGGDMDPDFAKAAFQLPSVGATSGVVATPFGWHIIRLVEILPEHRISFEDRRRWFKDETEAVRARRELERLREDLDRKYPVEVANGVDDLMTNATMTVLGAGDAASRLPAAP
jgi:parvulin-like peptidyl-prolyl isomerase